MSRQIENEEINLPKCCPNGTILNNNETNCVEADYFDSSPIEIYRNNESNYWLWENVIINFYHYDPCKDGEVR